MRYLIIGMIALIGSVFAAAMWLAPQHLQSNQPTHSGEALIGGAFELTDTKGKPFTEKDLLGKYSLIYFGFTYCPDICPTSLLIIHNALKMIGSSREKIQTIFISVDPERDTPDVMDKYVKNFDDHLIGLTGSLKQVQVVADAYKVYFSKIEQKDSALGYQVDHSGYIFLMGPDGKYITHFPHNVAEQTLTATLRAHIN